MKIKSKLLLATITICSTLFLGWGNVGHRIINTKTILSVTPSMSFWGSWSDSLAAHGSDADYRKSSDPDEAPKHYIDIDNYSEFISNGHITQIFDSLVLQHGITFVMDQGILPWAIMNTFDSLETAFQNNQFHKAMLLAADLGHYIGDMHMPLHITKNYNGQLTGQTGVHSRFESNMINTYSAQIIYSGDSLVYINNVSDFIFSTLYNNYIYVDSVLKCDSLAKAFAGNTTSSAYYSKLWELSKGFTTELFKSASHKLTCLIYTAWLNAGSPVSVEDDNTLQTPVSFNLYQNYPNPFNPNTKIIWQSSVSSHQTLKVYDVLGNEVATLVDEYRNAGSYEINFNASSLSSGIYFYKFTAGSFVDSKKMILLR
ncbi:MAG: T9SS type A sorting domain-containing protein [Ignavibacteriales bacterium]|nr:T9SS type A sorting domain-containing protein [Ignavibacteriales bacterium]